MCHHSQFGNKSLRAMEMKCVGWWMGRDGLLESMKPLSEDRTGLEADIVSPEATPSLLD